MVTTTLQTCRTKVLVQSRLKVLNARPIGEQDFDLIERKVCCFLKQWIGIHPWRPGGYPSCEPPPTNIREQLAYEAARYLRFDATYSAASENTVTYTASIQISAQGGWTYAGFPLYFSYVQNPVTITISKHGSGPSSPENEPPGDFPFLYGINTGYYLPQLNYYGFIPAAPSTSSTSYHVFATESRYDGLLVGSYDLTLSQPKDQSVGWSSACEIFRNMAFGEAWSYNGFYRRFDENRYGASGGVIEWDNYTTWWGKSAPPYTDFSGWAVMGLADGASATGAAYLYRTKFRNSGTRPRAYILLQWKETVAHTYAFGNDHLSYYIASAGGGVLYPGEFLEVPCSFGSGPLSVEARNGSPVWINGTRIVFDTTYEDYLTQTNHVTGWNDVS